MQTNFMCKGTMRVPGVRIGMIKAPTRTAWACLDVIPKHSTPICLLFSCIFTCFHDKNTSLGPICPAMSIQCRVAWFLTSVWAESNWYFPIASLYIFSHAHRTGESLCWRPHHRSKWHQQGLLLYTCWKDSETAAQVIFRCFVKYGDVVQFMHV